MPLCIHESNSGRSGKRGYPKVLMRLILAGLGLYAWFHTEQCLSEWLQSHGTADRPAPATHYDPGHVLFAPLKAWLEDRDLIQVACGVSATLSDATGLIMLVISLQGTTFRPALSSMVAFAMRWCLHALGKCTSKRSFACGSRSSLTNCLC